MNVVFNMGLYECVVSSVSALAIAYIFGKLIDLFKD